ncbi:MAG: chaperonin GroEL [Azospirillum sp.]|nr:chaperonin GroEL [Azospirillum sp.]
MTAAKRLMFRAEARRKVLEGASELADAIRVTLGPKSKSVLIERAWGPPLVCNDGVTIAKEFALKDPERNLGAQMLRQAAEKTGEAVGDGTSTATLLAHAILVEGERNVVAGAGALDIKRGLENAAKAAISVLKTSAIAVATKAQTAQVAALSAHNDAAIGGLVAEALAKVGGEGVVSVEESKTTETVLEVVEGMQFDRGFISPYFVTDADRLEAVLENARVLLCDKRIASLRDLVGVLEHVAKSGQALLIVAEEVEGEALATLILNRIRGVLKCCAVKAPGFGDRRKAVLEDIAILTGATVVTEDMGLKLETVTAEALGRVDRVVADGTKTTLIGGGGGHAAIAARIAVIRKEIAASTSDYDREKLRERLARLSGGVAVIRVGAPSEAEMKSRKEALDDSISAARAAVAEGIVPGGGLALLRCVPAVAALEKTSDGDERTGVRILKRALEAPARQIAENSGIDGGVAVARMLASEGALGLDAARNEYVDLIEAGIVDPVKVVRVALENAVSVASLLLLTEATMIALPEPKETTPAAADIDL